MPTFRIEEIPGEPIVIVTEGESFSPDTDGEAMLQELEDLFETNPELLYIIVDSRLPRYDYRDVVHGVNKVVPYLQRIGMEKLVLVGADDMKRLIAEGLTTDAFGNLPASFAASMDDALALVRG
ncbi:MAG: hypothetical protein GYB65_22325 [Chloroflexi bacterium]|nr:hypothetical protein [Chloroflexota bacterium]